MITPILDGFCLFFRYNTTKFSTFFFFIYETFKSRWLVKNLATGPDVAFDGPAGGQR